MEVTGDLRCEGCRLLGSAVQFEAVLSGEPGNGVDIEVEPEPLTQGLPCSRVRRAADGEKFAHTGEVVLEAPRRDDLQHPGGLIASAPTAQPNVVT